MNLKDDNEFDNLFKRAAESYPLNTNNANWEAVLSKLEEDTSSKGFLWFRKWFIIISFCATLIGIGFAISSVYLNNKYGINLSEKRSKTKIDAEDKEVLNNISKAVYSRVMDSLQRNDIIKEKLTINLVKHKFDTSLSKSTAISTQKKFGINIKHKTSFNEIKFSGHGDNKEALVQNNAGRNINSENINIFEKNNNELSHLSRTESVEVLKPKNITFVSAPVKEKLVDSNVINNLLLKNKKPVLKPSTKPFFYTGILYANDKSSLALNENKGSGYSLAFTLGYQFSKHWSFETGIHVEKKEYYTTGENFNKTILPAQGNLKWVEAENKLIEIPLLVRYHVPLGPKQKISATFGVSNYLVNKEYYEYEEEVSGVLQDGFIFYEKNTSNLLATYNFSLGYQVDIKKIGAFRIEPYINLPLKGIGVGREPLISRGIYIGWIYNFKH